MTDPTDFTWGKPQNPDSWDVDSHVYDDTGMCWCNPEEEFIPSDEYLVKKYPELFGEIEPPCNIWKHN